MMGVINILLLAALGFLRTAQFRSQRLPHNIIDVFLKCVCATAVVVLRAGLVVQMPLSFDVGVLQRIRPAPQLPRNLFGRGFEI